MRRMITMAAAAAFVGAATLALAPAAPAAERSAAPIASPSLLRPVQFYGGVPYYGGDWERRRHGREWRRERDGRRIEEAARREAWRIEREREERRAWRRAMREQYGYGGNRSW